MSSELSKYKSKVIGRSVKRAIARGDLTRLDYCEICLKPDGPLPYDIIAHHDDYLKPFEIVWVCRWCHNGIHDTFRAYPSLCPSGLLASKDEIRAVMGTQYKAPGCAGGKWAGKWAEKKRKQLAASLGKNKMLPPSLFT